MLRPEDSARRTIDKKLIEAGWLIQKFPKINFSVGVGIAIEEFPTDSGPADYALFIERKIVGIIEAKAEGTTLSKVEEQSIRYANSNTKWKSDNSTPVFIYESTGVETHFTDCRDPRPRAREVFNFHRPETLKEWLKQGKSLRTRLLTFPSLNPTGFRECQINAIQNLENAFAKNRPRSLVHMATGAGKTFTAISSIYRLLKFSEAKRILFLVDTRQLGEQAEQEFQAYTPSDDKRKFTELYNVQRLKSSFIDPNAHVCICTIQRMYSILRGEEMDESLEEISLNEIQQTGRPKEVAYNPKVSIEMFDFVIIDECHRSIYNLWRQVIEYFDAFLIGLTATPDDRTFGFFNKNIVSEYPWEQSVADGVNVPFDVFNIVTEISKNGAIITQEATQYIETRVKQSRKKVWESLEEDTTYTHKQLDNSVVNFTQIRTVIQEFKKALQTKIFPERINKDGEYEVPKTLIFAKTDAHAQDIIDIVREEFDEGNEFCKKITYNTEKPADVLSQFRTSYYPRIAVTVDMIATGTDVKALECLLFMRDVKSKSYFEQMKGRGTRTFQKDDLMKVTPSVTHHKSHFVIVDAVGVCKSNKSDSRPLERKPTVSLNNLMLNVVMGQTDEDTFTSLANRLIRLEKQLDHKELKKLEDLGGMTIKKVVSALLHAHDPDKIEEHAHKIKQAGQDVCEVMEQAQAELINQALVVFDNPDYRELVENIRRQHAQLIDHINLDKVIVADWDMNQMEQATDLMQDFKVYLEENQDKITALQIFYGQPYRRRELTFSMIKDLYEKLKANHPTFAPIKIWKAQEVLDNVQYPTPKNELLALVGLIRRVLAIDSSLSPYDATVNRNFQNWVFQKQAGTLKFTEEQMEWLRMIKDHVANSFHIDRGDFEYSPFVQKGGLGRIWQLFGDETDTILNELNESLAA